MKRPDARAFSDTEIEDVEVKIERRLLLLVLLGLACFWTSVFALFAGWAS